MYCKALVSIVRILVLVVVIMVPAGAEAVESQPASSTFHLRPVVPPTALPLNPRAAAVIGTTKLWVGSASDSAVRCIDLSSGGTRVLPVPPISGLVEGKGELWVAIEDEPTLVRLGIDGRRLEELRVPFVPTDIASLPDGTLVVANGTAREDEELLWRFDGKVWRPWALPVDRRVGVLDPATRMLLNTVRLAGGSLGVAVVFPLERSELVVAWTPSGAVASRPLPYFGDRWAPLGRHLVSALDVEGLARVAKPFADVLMTGRRVYCLSFQEGPWQGPERTTRGRHVVVMDFESGVSYSGTLPVDGCQLATDGDRVLLVDRHLGVWELQWEEK